MGYLDQAIEAFSRACESADGDIMPLAIELLAGLCRCEAATRTRPWSGSAA